MGPVEWTAVRLPGFFLLTHGSPEERGIYWAEWKPPHGFREMHAAHRFPGVVAPRAGLVSPGYGGPCHAHQQTQSFPPHPDWLITSGRLTVPTRFPPGSHPHLTPFLSLDSLLLLSLLGISRKNMTIQNRLSSLLPCDQLLQKKEGACQWTSELP